MSLTAFATLLERLAFTPQRGRKEQLLGAAFSSQPDPDRGLMLAALTGDLRLRQVTPGLLRGLAAALEHNQPELIALADEETHQAHTAHTTEPVPFIYVGKRDLKVREGGVLADVAPTMLMLLGLEKPAEMTGTSILV